MKCILNRILPWLVESGTLSPNQQAYIEGQGMNEHVFCLKTAIDDFKHESSHFYAVFFDFLDAFGSLPHCVMLHFLEEINLPEQYIQIVKDVYEKSFLQVICGHQLTKPVKIEVGIKMGFPWSAVNFIVALNHWLKWLCLLAPPGSTSPNPGKCQWGANYGLKCACWSDLHHDESSKKLNSRTCRYEILQNFHSQQHNHWVNLRLQGKLACLQCADPAVSHSALHNPAVNAGILKFVIKARLQALPLNTIFLHGFQNVMTHSACCITTNIWNQQRT